MLVTGSPGGSRIITTVLQVLMNVIDHGYERGRGDGGRAGAHQWLPDELRVERGLSVDTIRLLQARGHKVEVRQAMGSTSRSRARPRASKARRPEASRDAGGGGAVATGVRLRARGALFH